MVDERLLAAVRRFWEEEDVSTAYQQIFTAYSTRLSDVTVIVGKSNDGETANAQVVVEKEDFLEWMEILEARLVELNEDEETASGPATVNYSQRYVGS